MGRIGGFELLVILGILVLLFGANRLAGIGKGLGEGIRNFKDSFREGSDGDNKNDGGKAENKNG